MPDDNIKHIDISLRLVMGEKPLIEYQATTVLEDGTPDREGPLRVIVDEAALDLATTLMLCVVDSIIVDRKEEATDGAAG